MKFFAILSICFYDTVAALYLIPGHSHMFADRATAHAKGALKMKSVFHPKKLVQLANQVKNINALFLDHNVRRPPFFVGWAELLNKHFRNLPAGFTSDFLFRIPKRRSDRQAPRQITRLDLQYEYHGR